MLRKPHCAVAGTLLVSEACESYFASCANRARLTALVIVDEKLEPIGIFTERDVMRRVINKNLSAQSTTLDQGL